MRLVVGPMRTNACTSFCSGCTFNSAHSTPIARDIRIQHVTSGIKEIPWCIYCEKRAENSKATLPSMKFDLLLHKNTLEPYLSRFRNIWSTQSQAIISSELTSFKPRYSPVGIAWNPFVEVGKSQRLCTMMVDESHAKAGMLEKRFQVDPSPEL